MVALQDYPSVKKEAEVAAAASDRLPSLGKIHRLDENCAPPDLRVFLPRLTVNGDKVREVHDWSNHMYGLRGAVLNPPVEYVDAGAFLQLLSRRAALGGVDFRDCFPRRLAAPSCRRFLGVRDPASGRFGVYLFLPFGLGLFAGWGDPCVKEVLRVSREEVPSLKIIDFVGDPRMVDVSVARGELFVEMTKFKKLLGRLEIRLHAREGKHWRLAGEKPRLGIAVDTEDGVCRTEDKKVPK